MQALAERRANHLAAVRYKHPTAELEAYKQKYGLRGYKEAAKEIGCGEETLRGWVREGRLVAPTGVRAREGNRDRVIPVTRYLGPWAGNRPVLFTDEAIEVGRELLAAAYRGRGERMAAKRADGRIADKPRQGVVNTCPMCGKERYRSTAQADRKCCSDRCGQLYRWWVSRKGIAGMISPGWSGPSRRDWWRRERARRVGELNLPQYDDDQAELVHKIKATYPKWGRDRIAEVVRRTTKKPLTPEQVRGILRKPLS